MLDHLAGPHQLERSILERQRAVEWDEPEVPVRMPGARPDECGLCDLHADRNRARVGQRPGELTGPRTHFQRAIPGTHRTAQKREPALERGRLELGRQALPQILVVVPDRPTVPRKGFRPATERHFRWRVGYSAR